MGRRPAGSETAAEHPEVCGSTDTILRPQGSPGTGLGPARSLFAGWPAETWDRARAAELVRQENVSLALATATDAATEGLQDLARELAVQIETHERSETARPGRPG